MSVGWLIDANLFDDYRDDLVSAIQEQGHIAKLIEAPSPPFRWDDAGCSYRETFAEDACVVVHGDIELAMRVANEKRWRPGAFCTVENFYWSSYSCQFGKFLLNQDYLMMPFGELDRRRDFLFETLGREGKIFVRPDSPLKLFTGQTASRESFSEDLEFMGFYEFPERSMVAVSSPKSILAEWRFVVADGIVVAGSQYKAGDEFDSQATYDQAAFDLAQTIASQGYQPDPAWILDVCKTSDDKFHLLEIGGFSFSDLYACDKHDVVKAVSKVAKITWELS